MFKINDLREYFLEKSRDVMDGFDIKAVGAALATLLMFKIMDAPSYKNVSYQDLLKAIDDKVFQSLVMNKNGTKIQGLKIQALHEKPLILQSEIPDIAAAKDAVWARINDSRIDLKVKDSEGILGGLAEFFFVNPGQGIIDLMELAERGEIPDLQDFYTDNTRDLSILLAFLYLVHRMPGHYKKLSTLSEQQDRGEEWDRLVAYHEAGHAIVGMELQGRYTIGHATIIPSASTGGHVTFETDVRKISRRETYLNQIAVNLAGMAAENIIFGTHSDGVSRDIQQATSEARRMVTKLGMSDVGLAEHEQDFVVYKGSLRGYLASIGQRKISDETLRDIELEVRDILQEALQKADAVLRQNECDALHAVANALLNKKTLQADEIRAIIDSTKLQIQLDLGPI